MTTAEVIAEKLGSDGTTWKTENDETFLDLIHGYPHSKEEDRARELTRYIFEDKSAVVEGVGAWDIEGSEPFSWAGAEA